MGPFASCRDLVEVTSCFFWLLLKIFGERLRYEPTDYVINSLILLLPLF
jgi:hypothetical protein